MKTFGENVTRRPLPSSRSSCAGARRSSAGSAGERRQPPPWSAQCENTQRGYARAHPREAARRREVAARGGPRRRRAGGSRARAARARAHASSRRPTWGRSPSSRPSRSSCDGVARFDDRGLPWNEALPAAMTEVVHESVVAVVAADLPRLTAAEVRSARLSNTGVRDRHRARHMMAARTPSPCARRERSRRTSESLARADVHERAAWLAGGDAHVLDCPGLAFDVDTPEDLAAWRAS